MRSGTNGTNNNKPNKPISPNHCIGVPPRRGSTSWECPVGYAVSEPAVQ